MLDGNSEEAAFKGTHGTSKTRAAAILKGNAFTPSDSESRWGSGVYLWAYEDDIRLATYLAKDWWSISLLRFGTYKKDFDKGLAILNVELKDPGAEYFDATSEKFLADLADIARSKDLPDNNESFNKLKAAILIEIESESDRKYSLVKAKVETPATPKGSNCISISYGVCKSADCYIIRHRHEELIKKIEQIA